MHPAELLIKIKMENLYMKRNQKLIRYAVVGLGHIAQSAVLPSFRHAIKNSKLVALVSDDSEKLKELSKRYKTEINCHYDEYHKLLRSGEIDAVYISTPNSLHYAFASLAAKEGIHVLCEKPLTADLRTAFELQEIVRRSRIKFMTAYRLHFDAANLDAIKMAHSSKFGTIRAFNSVFTMQVRDRDNIRLKTKYGGGPLLDLGVYCINAARYLFRDEPYEVFGTRVNNTDERFTEVDEMLSVVLKFPQDRLASFICSFGASDCSEYKVVGTSASLSLENAFDYALPMKLSFTKDEKTSVKKYSKHDQFGAELIYFSECILKNTEPEPSLKEGLIDLQIIRAIERSCDLGEVVPVSTEAKAERPESSQRISKPGISKPNTVNVVSPSLES